MLGEAISPIGSAGLAGGSATGAAMLSGGVAGSARTGNAAGSAAAGPARPIRSASSAAVRTLTSRRHGSGRGGGAGLRGRLSRRELELELIVRALHLDASARWPLAAQDELRERILEVLLDRALEGPGAQRRVESPVDEQLDGLRADLELDLLDAQAFFDLAEQDAHDTPHVVAREGVEDDDIIDAIEELRVEGTLQLVLDRALDGLELRRAALRLLEPQVLAAADDLAAAEVRRHDDDGVLEV